jgi:hypothetical protein
MTSPTYGQRKITIARDPTREKATGYWGAATYSLVRA